MNIRLILNHPAPGGALSTAKKTPPGRGFKNSWAVFLFALYNNLDGVKALGALLSLVADALPLAQGLVPVRLDCRIMDKDVIPPIGRLDESKALGIIEPFDSTTIHTTPPLYYC